MVYTYRWDTALVRSLAIHPEDQIHPHVIKDIIPHYSVILDIKSQTSGQISRIHLIQSRKLLILPSKQKHRYRLELMELSSDFSSPDVNKINMDGTSCDEFKVNEVCKGKNWKNNYRKSGYSNNQNYSSSNRYGNKEQDNKSGNKWECKERDSKITLLNESSHFIPAKFGESFFRQFDLAMQLRKEELKKQGKVEAEVSEVIEEDVISTFGVTKDHMLEVAKILETEGNTKNLGHTSA